MHKNHSFFATIFTTLMLIGVAVAPVHGATMRDESIKIEKSTGFFGVKLATRIYAPEGEGPFPLVVVNHGKSHGNTAFQKDRAYYFQAREFVKRGFAVMVPTRQGFGSSGGVFMSAGCNVASTGELQADDIEVAIRYAKTLPYIDGARIVVIGQSVGGLATMALGERNIPGVLGLIDMAGGMRTDQCPGWEKANIDAFSQYGKKTRVPALMMYGDNDGYWGRELPKQMADAYIAAGGKGQWIDYGVFENDSHETFAHRAGMALWMPAYEKFFTSLGLPFNIQYPLQSDQAGVDIDDIDAVPNLNLGARQAYQAFLDIDPHQHRAFAMSQDGHFGYAHGERAVDEALSKCNAPTSLKCELYAVDTSVVYKQAAHAKQ